MSRMAGATTARLRLALAVLVGGSAALLLPPSLAATAGAPSGVVLAAVALAALASLVRLNSLVAGAQPQRRTPQSRATAVPISFLAGRVTDPLHHPLRPRAPGLA